MNLRSALPAAGLAFLLCAGCSPTLSIAPPTLVSGTTMSEGRRNPTSVFHLDDRVVTLIDITWADPQTDAGFHICEWKWYRDGQLVSDSQPVRLFFRHTPTTLRATRAAAPLGVGNYTVQFVIDDKLVATSPFTIVA